MEYYYIYPGKTSMFKQNIKELINDNFWRKLIKNFTLAFSGNSVASIFQLIITMLMVKLLGDTDYSIFILAQQYMAAIDALINFQSWQGVIQFGIEAKARNDKEKLCAVIKGGALVDLFTAIIGATIAIFGAIIMHKFSTWDSTRILIASIFSIEIIFHLEGTSVGVFRLFDKYNIISIHSALSSLLTAVLISICCLLNFDNILTVTIVYVISDVVRHVSLLIVAIIFLRKKKLLSQVIHSKIKSAGKEFYKFTVWTNLASAADMPVQYMDMFLISTISLEMVAIYKVFKQLTQTISRLTKPVSQAILPQLSEMVVGDKKKEAYNKVLEIRNIVYCIVGTALIACLAFGKPVLNYLFGTKYGDNVFLLALMIVAYGIGFAYVAIHPFYLSLGKAKEDLMLNLISNILYCIVSITLVKLIGVYGAVISIGLQSLLVIILKKRSIVNNGI